MANGKHGDHPLTDILLHGLDVYGKETDALIRQIAELCSRRELDEWWEREVGWTNNSDSVLGKAKTQLAILKNRAKENGWELPIWEDHIHAANVSLLTVLKEHKQIHDWSCAASAHEFIAKLHGKLKVSDFPLQNNPASQKGGFQFETFLNSIGFSGNDKHLPPTDALNILIQETDQGRFPLVSILAGIGTSSTYWHIVVAAKSGNEVVLVDPALQRNLTNSSTDTLLLLQTVVAKVLDRDKIHLLVYKKRPSDP